MLHEADATKLVAVADRLMAGGVERRTPLATLRTERGMTQSELAGASGVKLHMIQLYEQRQNDLAKASVAVVVRLSNAIGCKVEDLLEPAAAYRYAVVEIE